MDEITTESKTILIQRNWIGDTFTSGMIIPFCGTEGLDDSNWGERRRRILERRLMELLQAESVIYVPELAEAVLKNRISENIMELAEIKVVQKDGLAAILFKDAVTIQDDRGGQIAQLPNNSLIITYRGLFELEGIAQALGIMPSLLDRFMYRWHGSPLVNEEES